MNLVIKIVQKLLLILIVSLFPSFVMATDLNGADTAWIMTSTALVLFMTIPGLSLFYAGLVRSKNVLGVLVLPVSYRFFGYSVGTVSHLQRAQLILVE